MNKTYKIVPTAKDEPYRWWRLFDDTYVIHCGEALDTFLLLGEEKALLIDTAYGLGEFPNIVDTLKGDKELLVVNTHGHYDHTGGNKFFPRVHMHPAAFDIADRAFWPLDPEWEANMPYPNYEKIAVDDGYVFDLGGRQVEVISTPAHAASSLTFLDHKRRLLFCGDELDAGQANLGTFETVGMFLKNCKMLKAREAEYDFIMPNHNGCPISKTYLDDFITAAQHVVDGCPDIVEKGIFEYQISFGVDRQRVQVGDSCINYWPEGVVPHRP